MTYAAPLAYAAKAITYDPYAPANRGHHQRPVKRRRRRIRATLLPALSPRRSQSTAPPALAADSSRSR